MTEWRDKEDYPMIEPFRLKLNHIWLVVQQSGFLSPCGVRDKPWRTCYET